jgi:hypothetical protein
MARSTGETSKMLEQKTSETSLNAISLRESEAGHTHFDWPVGTTLDLFGPGLAHASHSPPQVNKKAPTTTDTSGLFGLTSSASADLQSFLESKLHQQFGTAGSTLYSMNWKEKTTPAGRRFCQLVASAHRTFDSDCGSWPTPTAADGPKIIRSANGALNEVKRKGGPQDLSCAAQLTHWPTATANDLDQLGRQVGQIQNGSPAQTEKPGRLNPAFALWLMGYPPQWMDAAPSAAKARSLGRAMQSSRKSPPNS